MRPLLSADPRRGLARALVLFALVAVLALTAAVALRGVRSAQAVLDQVAALPVTERVVRESVLATLQREVQDAFLITGRLEATASTRVRDRKALLPWIGGGLDLGTTSATVRVPGTLHYGIDVSALDASAIRLRDDGVVEIDVPLPRLKAVEPRLSAMEVRTEVGWARMHARSGREAEMRAIALVERAFREQGGAHLADSREPRLATARALALMLAPALRAAGIEEPRFLVNLPGLSVRVAANNPPPPAPHPIG